MNTSSHPALRRLVQLRRRAAIRHLTRLVRRPVGFVGLLGTLAFFGATLAGPMLGVHPWEVEPEVARAGATAAFCGLWMLALVGRTGNELETFGPPDIDQLFAAPVTEDQLIRMRLTTIMVTALLTALPMLPAVLMFASWVPAGLIAVTSFVLFQQLSGLLALLLGARSPDTPTGRRVRAASRLALALLAAVVVGVGRSADPTWPAWLLAQVPVRIVLAPFVALGDLMVATSALQALFPTVVALGTVAALIRGVTIAARGTWRASALEQVDLGLSQRQRVASQGLSGLGGQLRLGLWRLPHLGGLGTLVRVRLLMALRATSVWTVFGGFALFGLIGGAFTPEPHKPLLVLMATLLSSFGMMLTASDAMHLDLHGDLDRLDALRTLPIPSHTAFVGSVLPAVMVVSAATVLQVLLMAAWWQMSPRYWVPALVLLPSSTALYLFVRNAVFLWIPYRVLPGRSTPSDVLRSTVSVLVGMYGSIFIVTLAVSLGAAAGWLTDSVLVGVLVTVGLELGWSLLAALLGGARLARMLPVGDT